MRQRNGSELFGQDDPRSSTIGIIDIAPEDDQRSVLAAIFTQEKLQRRQTLVVLPEQSYAFRRLAEFKAFLKTVKTQHTSLVFVLSSGSRFMRIAREHHFPVFTSLEEYSRSARDFSISPLTEQSPSADASTLSSREEAQSPQSPQDIEPLPLDPQIIQLPSSIPSVPVDARKSEDAQGANKAREPLSPSIPLLRTPSKRRRPFLLVAVIALLLLLIGGSILSVLLGFGPLAQLLPFTATITITPAEQVLTQRYQFVAVTETSDPVKQQIQARFLSSTAFSRTQTVRSSGTGIIPARSAQGMLTFYNALTQAQTIPAGTILSDGNGIQLSSDQAVAIPAANPPTEGVITAAMHSLTPGERGNIAAFDLAAFACCHAGITVTNPQPFSGGTDQKSYSYLQQIDIDTAAQALQLNLTPLGEKAVQAQILPGEQIMNPIHCVSKVVSNHLAGERVSNATITQTVQCLTEVYNRQDAQLVATNLLTLVGQKNLGTQYALASHITTKLLTIAHPDNKGATALQMSAQGTWRYQVHDIQKRELAKLVAGKKKDVAKALLLRQPGIHDVGIMLSRIASSTLPNDPHSIVVQIQAPPDPPT